MSWKILSIVVTLIIAYVAITQLDWSHLLNVFLSADWSYIGYALIVWVFLLTLKGLKWQILLRAVNGSISLTNSIRVLFIGLFISIITPGRMGDFARAWYVKEHVPIGKGILTVLIDRILDVLFLMILATLGLLLLIQTKGVELFSPLFAGLLFLVAIAGAYIMLNQKWARFIWKKFQRFLPASYRSLIREYGSQFYETVPMLRKKKGLLLLATFYSFLSWILSITFGWLVMLSLGYPVEWGAALITIPILALVEILPTGVMGLGTREIAAVIILGAYGISPEGAVAFSLLYFAVGYIPSFLLGAYFFNRNPTKINKDSFFAKEGSDTTPRSVPK